MEKSGIDREAEIGIGEEEEFPKNPAPESLTEVQSLPPIGVHEILP